MASSLWFLVDNLAEEIHKIECKYKHDKKTKKKESETCRITTYFLENTNVKDDIIEYKCLWCNKNFQKQFDENLKMQFVNTYKFFNHKINKFILLLRKNVYPYQYMDGWEKFNETSLPEKEDFYSHLNMEDITDVDYAHVERVCKNFEIKKY